MIYGTGSRLEFLIQELKEINIHGCAAFIDFFPVCGKPTSLAGGSGINQKILPIHGAPIGLVT